MTQGVDRGAAHVSGFPPPSDHGSGAQATPWASGAFDLIPPD